MDVFRSVLLSFYTCQLESQPTDHNLTHSQPFFVLSKIPFNVSRITILGEKVKIFFLVDTVYTSGVDVSLFFKKKQGMEA